MKGRTESGVPATMPARDAARVAPALPLLLEGGLLHVSLLDGAVEVAPLLDRPWRSGRVSSRLPRPVSVRPRNWVRPRRSASRRRGVPRFQRYASQAGLAPLDRLFLGRRQHDVRDVRPIFGLMALRGQRARPLVLVPEPAIADDVRLQVVEPLPTMIAFMPPRRRSRGCACTTAAGGLLLRPQAHRHLVEVVEAALEAQLVVAEAAQHDLERLLVARQVRLAGPSPGPRRTLRARRRARRRSRAGRSQRLSSMLISSIRRSGWCSGST